MKGLTARQEQIVVFINRYAREYGFAPSFAEIGAAVRLSSISSVKHQMDSLAKAGVIRHLPGQPRAVAVLPPHNTLKKEGSS